MRLKNSKSPIPSIVLDQMALHIFKMTNDILGCVDDPAQLSSDSATVKRWTKQMNQELARIRRQLGQTKIRPHSCIICRPKRASTG